MLIDPNQGGGMISPGGPKNLPRRPGQMRRMTAPPLRPPIARPMPGQGRGIPGRGPGVPGNPNAGRSGPFMPPPMRPPVAKPLPPRQGGINPGGGMPPMPGGGGPQRLPGPPNLPPVQPMRDSGGYIAQLPPPPGMSANGGFETTGPFNLPPMMDNGGVASHGPVIDNGGVMLGGPFNLPPMRDNGGIASHGGGDPLMDQLIQRKMQGQYGPQTGIGMGVNPALQNY